MEEQKYISILALPLVFLMHFEEGKKQSDSRVYFHLSIRNKLRIPPSGNGPTAPGSGRGYGIGHSGGGYGGHSGGGYGGGHGGGYGGDQLVLLRPPQQDSNGGGLSGLLHIAS